MFFVCVHFRLTAYWTNNTLFYPVYGFNLIKKSKKNCVLKHILYRKTKIFCVVHASKCCFEGFVISAGKRPETKLHVGLVLVRGKSRVWLWCERCERCERCRRRCWCCGTYRSVLVARTVADIWRQRVGIHRFVPCRSHVGFAGYTWQRRVAGLGTEDESGLVLLLKVGDVFHHGFTVGDRQLVGAVWHQVEVACDEDDWERKHGHYDESEAHGQSPGRVALETFLSLQG